MGPLPLTRLSEHRTDRVGVSVFSTIRAGQQRLLRAVAAHRRAGRGPAVLREGRDLLRRRASLRDGAASRGSGNARIDYRHVIFSLVRKPGAFARYRYREALFPTVTFRCAYDALVERLGEGADLALREDPAPGRHDEREPASKKCCRRFSSGTS